jgi:hypothetical protein
MQPSAEDDNLPDSTDVVILVNDAGEIVECLDARSGKSLQHAFVVQHSVPHRRFIAQHNRREHDSIMSEHDELQRALSVVRVGEFGECIVFNEFDKPPASGFPFGVGPFAFCEGMLLCEIKGLNGEVLDDRSLLATRFEMTTAFRGYEHVDPPGLLMSQREKEDMCAIVSPFHHALDPLLKMYEDNWKESWGVGLSSSQDHFVGVYKSDWNGVARETCASSGHDIGVHYYIVVRGGLPETTAEQVAWIARIATNDTWETRMGSLALNRATEMARHARITLMQRALRVMNVQLVGDPVSTEWNIAKPAIYRLDSNGSVETRAAFYRRCASSAECKAGVLTMSDDETILWMHGPPTSSRTIGGKSWSNTECANAFPVFRDDVRNTHEGAWGSCVLKQLFFVS